MEVFLHEPFTPLRLAVDDWRLVLEPWSPESPQFVLETRLLQTGAGIPGCK